MKKKSSKVINPLTGETVNAKSTLGKDIVIFNRICKKCPVDKVFDISINKCIPKLNSPETLKDQINYCNQYDKLIRNKKTLSKRNLIFDKKIIENILNIRIPKHLINNKSMKFGDIIKDKTKHIKAFSFAKRLGIYDINYKK
jgi:hypothetical protein